MRVFGHILNERKFCYFGLSIHLNHKIWKEMKRYEELKSLVDGLEDDFTKFYEKGNKAAGTRVRKGMQDLKVLAQDIRKEVQDMKNE